MKPLRLLLAAVLLTAITGLQAQTLLRGPYLQMPTEHSIVVKWRTDVSDTGTVLVGNSPTNLTMTYTEDSAAIDHSVTIDNLDTNTTYYYQVKIGSTVLAGGNDLCHFKTDPQDGEVLPIRIWAIGDFGRNSTDQRNVATSYLNYTGNRGTDVWLWLGDNAYNDGLDQEYQDKVFDVYDTMFNYMPFMPCPGNHDYGSISPPQSTVNPPDQTGPYFDIITVPTNGEAGGVASGYELYYSYDYGNVHFVSLNSELGSATSSSDDWTGAYSFVPIIGTPFNGSPMTQWLESDLQANDKPWVIVYFHQPPYSKGSHDSDGFYEIYMRAMREYFTPIFDQYGVDMVINGHSHVYERSYPVYGHTGAASDFNPATMQVSSYSGYDSLGEAYVKLTYGPDANKGTIYTVVGCSGTQESSPALNHPVMFYGLGGSINTGSMVIDVDGKRLDARFLRSDGQTFDHFTILKRDSTDPSGTGVVLNALENNVTVYPNPFTSELTVDFTVQTKITAELTLFDVKGEQLYTTESQAIAGKNRFSIDAAKLQLPDGVYYIQLKVGGATLTRKVMKL